MRNWQMKTNLNGLSSYIYCRLLNWWLCQAGILQSYNLFWFFLLYPSEFVMPFVLLVAFYPRSCLPTLPNIFCSAQGICFLSLHVTMHLNVTLDYHSPFASPNSQTTKCNLEAPLNKWAFASDFVMCSDEVLASLQNSLPSYPISMWK